jgi:hypothetical protein
VEYLLFGPNGVWQSRSKKTDSYEKEIQIILYLIDKKRLFIVVLNE